VVIDEAGQCHPAHAVSALLRCRSAMVIGDVHQLAPVVELNADDEARLFRSFWPKASPERLRPYRVHAAAHVSSQLLAERAAPMRHTLVDHFRCQPEIIAVSDALCDYGLRVHTPRASRRDRLPFLAHPLSMVDLAGEQERLGGSLCNELEREHTLALLQHILSAGIAVDDIAVITPYRGQLERLRRGFSELGIPLEHSAELAEGDGPAHRASRGVALGTVHRFQGGERSIVLFSSVVTRPSSLSFLNARPNLLNVALSRARHHFVCLGHRTVLAQGARTLLLTRAAQALSPRTPA
jgi:superfamily I DNA and/or RNA helicase